MSVKGGGQLRNWKGARLAPLTKELAYRIRPETISFQTMLDKNSFLGSRKVFAEFRARIHG
jgi:hypothetical protein